MRHARGSTQTALVAALLVVGLSACQKGCAKTWFEKHGVGEPGGAPRGGGAVHAVDCPDGLARCTDGVVEVSRLATIQQPCSKAEGCTCPWERAGDCLGTCVASGATVVVDRSKALRQLCAPAGDDPPVSRSTPPQPADCGDDPVLYRCTGGDVVSCADHALVAHCLRGCVAAGGEIGDDSPMPREAAFAILCSR